jgi:TonB-linked SusC/RagA family outer membrane protein
MKKNKPSFKKMREPASGCHLTVFIDKGTRRKFRVFLILCLGFIATSSLAIGQTLTVEGSVTEVSGDPMQGVNVFLKDNSSVGTITSSDGTYILQRVPTNAVLVFSFIGYKTVEIPVEGKNLINMQMQEDVTSFPEVVVYAGYYSMKERERTGSISIVNASEIANQPVNNVLSAVQGQMAGVNIAQATGAPGGGYNIQIRGINSLRREGNYPMYIIDGVPVSAQTPSNSLSAGILPYTIIDPLNAINPNDIESIEVLKDADATAIYGSRGGNGVILVTTKRGKSADEARFSVNSSYGLSQVASKMKLLNTAQYLEMRKQAYANDGITTYPANAYDINGTWDQTHYTDWQKELVGKTATNKNVQISISGGTEKTSFLLSGTHSEQSTVFGRNFRYKTDNLASNMSYCSDDNKFRLNASGLFSAQDNNIIVNDITSQTLKLIPNAPALYKEDGNLNWANSTWTNPVADYVRTYSNENKALNFSLNINYKFLPSLSFKFNGGINLQLFDEMSISPSTRYNPAFGVTPSSSSVSKGNNRQFSGLIEPQINYTHKFSEHKIDFLAGCAYQQNKTNSLGVDGYGFDSNILINNLTSAKTIEVSRDDISDYIYCAIFGRLNYQYKSKYIFNLTGRRDGSSRFGPDKRFSNFGAVGAAWMFSQENFLKDSRVISFGKFRASYGVTGSDLIGDYQYLDTYVVSSTTYGGSTSLYPSKLFNPYFSWEKTRKLEVAVELGFLKDRIHLNTAWYRNCSGNQLVGIPLPATTGFTSVQANLPATVENTGLEIEVNAIPIESGELQWKSNFNVSLPRNKLLKFPGLEGSTYSSNYVVGYPVSIAKVYNYEGIDPETGHYIFTDYNNDGNISSPDDKQVIRKIGVKYYGGWANQLTYKHWEFSFLLQFVNQVQWNYNNLMAYPGTMNNQPAQVLDVWSESNTDGRYMPYTSGADSQKSKLDSYFRTSTASISDASFIRLKNIQISYRLILKKYNGDIQLYVQGQNILTLTNYFGLDPEYLLSGYLPPLKTWSTGIKFNF